MLGFRFSRLSSTRSSKRGELSGEANGEVPKKLPAAVAWIPRAGLQLRLTKPVRIEKMIYRALTGDCADDAGKSDVA